MLAGIAATSPASAWAESTPVATTATRREVLRQRLAGGPSLELVLVEVTYPPRTGSPPHDHPAGATAFVVRGTIVSRLDGFDEQTYHEGAAWYEPPGSRHLVSRNASATESAVLLAIYIAAPNATLIHPLGGG